MSAPTGDRLPVVLCLGMGLDSVAILLRWLTDPSCRDFALEDLVVLTAMTGDEYARTATLMETFVLPLMRRHQVRYVQIARAGQATAAGFTVLDDSRSPQRMHMRGPWALSEELTATGTVPQVATGRRLCSIRAKGDVLDAWIDQQFPGRRYRHVIGFAAEETRRATKDFSFSGHDQGDRSKPLRRIAPALPVEQGEICAVPASQGRKSAARRCPEYPLIVWGWDRQACDDYIREQLAVGWSRSCCTYCPFQASGPAGIADLVARWTHEPRAAVSALILEHRAMALNERSLLFGGRAGIDLVREHDLTTVLAAFTDTLREGTWSVYEVRRVLHPRAGQPTVKGTAWRSIRVLADGDHDQMHSHLAHLAARAGHQVDIDRHGIARVRVRERGTTYPTVEHLYVAGPAGAHAKERRGFAAWWNRLVLTPQTVLL